MLKIKSVLQKKSWKSQYSNPPKKSWNKLTRALKLTILGERKNKNMPVFKDNQKSWKSQYWEWSACNRFPQILHYSNPQSEMPRLL